MSYEETLRADYMMEAFLDEQNTLIRPLVSRKLALVHALEERAVVLEETRKKLSLSMLNVPMAVPKRGGTVSEDLSRTVQQIERVETALEQIANEKVTVCLQLMDLVRRPYDTIVEVESALKSAIERGGGGQPGGGTDPVNSTQTKRSNQVQQQHTAVLPSQQQMEVPIVSSELWCFCRKPDDGRPMVACDSPHCDIGWWHTDCLDSYIQRHHIGSSPPTDENSTEKWMCPICVAAEIVKKEQLAVATKKKRAGR